MANLSDSGTFVLANELEKYLYQGDNFILQDRLPEAFASYCFAYKFAMTRDDRKTVEDSISHVDEGNNIADPMAAWKDVGADTFHEYWTYQNAVDISNIIFELRKPDCKIWIDTNGGAKDIPEIHVSVRRYLDKEDKTMMVESFQDNIVHQNEQSIDIKLHDKVYRVSIFNPINPYTVYVSKNNSFEVEMHHFLFGLYNIKNRRVIKHNKTYVEAEELKEISSGKLIFE